MHSKEELARLDKITALVIQLSDTIKDGEVIYLWKKNDTPHCKVGFEEMDELPVRCMAEVGYMLGAAKAVFDAGNCNSGLLPESEYFL